jgi:hypothetical protein
MADVAVQVAFKPMVVLASGGTLLAAKSGAAGGVQQWAERSEFSAPCLPALLTLPRTAARG